MTLITPPHLVPKVLEKNRTIPLLTLKAGVAYKKGENLHIGCCVNTEDAFESFICSYRRKIGSSVCHCVMLLTSKILYVQSYEIWFTASCVAEVWGPCVC